MKLHYDPQTDSLYLRISDAPVVESEEVRPGIILDFDASDRVISVEILNLRKHFPDADIDQLRLDVA